MPAPRSRARARETLRPSSQPRPSDGSLRRTDPDVRPWPRSGHHLPFRTPVTLGRLPLPRTSRRIHDTWVPSETSRDDALDLLGLHISMKRRPKPAAPAAAPAAPPRRIVPQNTLARQAVACCHEKLDGGGSAPELRGATASWLLPACAQSAASLAHRICTRTHVLLGCPQAGIVSPHVLWSRLMSASRGGGGPGLDPTRRVVLGATHRAVASSTASSAANSSARPRRWRPTLVPRSTKPRYPSPRPP